MTLPAVLAAALLAAGLVSISPAAAAPTGYVRMSDGTLIAISVHHPPGFVPGDRYPTVFEMSGYDGGSASGQTLMGDLADATGLPKDRLPLVGDSRQLTEPFSRAGYVVVHASVRGTGCSGGEFDLFSWRSALDGREVIDWIAGQPWSDGKVGIMGHSYGGITGFMVAATRPAPLVGVTVSGLIDDLYRGIVYPGGVSNYGFPLLWTGAIRPFTDIAGGTAPGIVRTQDPVCAANAATHTRTVLSDPIVNGLADTDNTWWRAKSLLEYVERIDVPIHVYGGYQDEQTGPRGPANLWEHVTGVPKRLVLSNGDHNTWQSVPRIVADRVRWLDHWTGRADHGFGAYRRGGVNRNLSVTVDALFDVTAGRARAVKTGADYPFPDTRWTEWHLRAGGTLSTATPGTAEGSASYVSGSMRQSWSYHAGPTEGAPVTTAAGPDELRFTSEPFADYAVLAGPATATLHLSSTEPDTELFVQVVDVAPDDARTFLSRGLLRASHRAVNDGMSDHTGDGRIYRPFRPHTNPTPVVPATVTEYLVEIFPLGHVLRPGHRLQLVVSGPPAVDSFYVYVPRRLPGAVNTVWHDRVRASRLMLPVVPLDPATIGTAPPCGEAAAVRCIPPATSVD